MGHYRSYVGIYIQQNVIETNLTVVQTEEKQIEITLTKFSAAIWFTTLKSSNITLSLWLMSTSASTHQKANEGKWSTNLWRSCIRGFYLCPIGQKLVTWLTRSWSCCHTQQQGMFGNGSLSFGQPWSQIFKLRVIYLFILLLGFPDSSVGKASACNAGDLCLIPGSEKSGGEGIGYPLQYSWASLVA